MFEKYNRIQKYAYLIALIFFIVGNIFALILLLLFSSRPSEANYSFAKLQNLNGNQSILRDIQIGERVSLSSGYTYLENESVEIFSSSSSSMYFIDQRTANFEKGVFLIYSKSDINISYMGKLVRVDKFSTILIDDQEDRIIVLEGRIFFDNLSLANNQYINLNNTEEIKEFERSDLASLNRFVDLNIVLTNFDKDLAAFSDLVPPSIISISPLIGSTVESQTLRVTGKIEAGSKIFMDELPISSDSFGNFAFNVEMEEGENLIELYLEDIYGNSSSYPLIYFVDTQSSIPEL